MIGFLRGWASLVVGGMTATVYALVLELAVRAVNPEHALSTAMFLNLLTTEGGYHDPVHLLPQVVKANVFGAILSLPLAAASFSVDLKRVVRAQLLFVTGLALVAGVQSVLVFLLDPLLPVPAELDRWPKMVAGLAVVRADVTAQALSALGWTVGPSAVALILIRTRHRYVFELLAPAVAGLGVGAWFGLFRYWLAPESLSSMHVSTCISNLILGAAFGGGAGLVIGFCTSLWSRKPAA